MQSQLHAAACVRGCRVHVIALSHTLARFLSRPSVTGQQSKNQDRNNVGRLPDFILPFVSVARKSTLRFIGAGHISS